MREICNYLVRSYVLEFGVFNSEIWYVLRLASMCCDLGWF
jgi:hypothetical protein